MTCPVCVHGVLVGEPCADCAQRKWPRSAIMQELIDAQAAEEEARRPEKVLLERMIKNCVPGGSICDPQLVADNIRAWFAPHQPSKSLPDDATKAHKRVGNVLAAMFDDDHPMRKDWEAVGMALPRK